MAFGTNVFINCPFDEDFKPILKAITFTLLYLELEPRISQTKSSSSNRIEEIIKLIRTSRFGIHDLSRSRPKKDELPRFNMPYELGLDIGCFKFGSKKFSQKRILVLEKDKYYYQKILSDIAGQDVEDHNDDPKTVLTKVRNWLSVNHSGHIPGPSEIWMAYNQFNEKLFSLLSGQYSNRDIEEMPIGDYIKYGKDWVREFKRK